MQACGRVLQPVSTSFELCSSTQLTPGLAVQGVTPQETQTAPRIRSAQS